MYLKSRYAPDQLFQVSADYQARETMDLAVAAGTIVGVIKDKDPLGGGDRWFVDSGESKGFLPSSILVKCAYSQQQHQQPQSSSSQAEYQYQATVVPSNSLYQQPEQRKGDAGNYYSELLDLEVGGSAAVTGSAYYCNLDDISSPNDNAESSRTQPQQAPCENPTPPATYRVLYTFDGMGSNTLPIAKGDLVEFLIGHDQEGNSEWWYVKSMKTEGKGYVPANYLTATK